MTFKEWLKSLEETSTSTGDVASFARPIMVAPRRMYPDPVVLDEKKKKKKK